jgi:hypothetical protein
MKQTDKLIVITIISILIFSTNSVVVCTGASKIAHASGYNDTDHYICNCDSSYIWRPSVHACVLDCEKISYAKSNCIQSQSNIEVCDCILGFKWEPSSNICVRDCTNTTIVNTKDTVYNTLKID